MKKRMISGLLAFLLFFSWGFTAQATIAEKLQGHWAQASIDRNFLGQYFPYLARENFRAFNPNGELTREDFTLSLASLFRSHGYSVSGLSEPGPLTRERMVYIVGLRLQEIGFPSAADHPLPFGDLAGLGRDRTEQLKLLHRENIVRGESNSVFNPGRRLTQAEAVVVLARIDKAIREFNQVEYRTLAVTQGYNGQEEIKTRLSEDKVILTVTRQFPTPGYSIAVSSIARDNDSFRVYFAITPLDPDMILPQVITFKTIIIEIDMDELGEPPYDFVVDGFRSQ